VTKASVSQGKDFIWVTSKNNFSGVSIFGILSSGISSPYIQSYNLWDKEMVWEGHVLKNGKAS
jgi:hypothetical protein